MAMHAVKASAPGAPSTPETSPSSSRSTHPPQTVRDGICQPFAVSGGLPVEYRYDKSATESSGTRAPTKADYNLREKDQLKRIYVFPNMISDPMRVLVETGVNSSINNVLNQPVSNPAIQKWWARIDPAQTHIGAPPVVFSEVDIQTHLSMRVFQPSALTTNCFLNPDEELEKTLQRTDLYVASSSHDFPSIPDARLRYKAKSSLLEPKPEERTMVTKEVKKETVLRESGFVELGEQQKDFRSYFDVWSPFHWFPSSDDAKGIKKHDKMLVQVWTQLVVHKVQWGALTSFKDTIFLYRDPKQPNTLYLTEVVPFEELSLAHFVTLHALAVGLPGLQVPKLPKCDPGVEKVIQAVLDSGQPDTKGLDARFKRHATGYMKIAEHLEKNFPNTNVKWAGNENTDRVTRYPKKVFIESLEEEDSTATPKASRVISQLPENVTIDLDTTTPTARRELPESTLDLEPLPLFAKGNRAAGAGSSRDNKRIQPKRAASTKNRPATAT